MALIQTRHEIEYPDSDGEPMGESDWHIDWTIRLRDLLKWRYRDQPVYIGSDLIIYYQEGNPKKSVAPDGFVVLNHSPKRRRIYKVWEEDNRVPDVVFEFTSLSSESKDTKKKPGIYAALGVNEYFIYDPEREYLKPPLQGFRLAGNRYVAIEADADQVFQCQTLGLGLRLRADELVVIDLATGEELMTHAEAEAESRRNAEAENERLRAELKRLRDET